MFKDDAIALLGGSAQSAAQVVGVTCQAVNKWPAVLPLRISDRVLGACLRNGMVVPARYLRTESPTAPANQAQAAINTEASQQAQGVAHG